MSKHSKVIVVDGFPHKKCNECLDTKPIEDFYEGRAKCKKCIIVRTLKYYTDDKERRKKYKRNNHEEISKKNSEYHFENRDKKLKQHKEWYKKNYHTKVVPYQKEYNKIPEVAAVRSLRQLLRDALNRVGTKKEKHSMEYVDYTPEEFRKHIESLWKPGMTWENHGQGDGTWQIDHTKEVRIFVDEGITDPNIVNELNNLQPLWDEEHRKKSGEFIHNRCLEKHKELKW